jgi:hypothetical protein
VFYTYSHATPQGQLFYIGKGQGKRAYKLNYRSAKWNNLVAKHGKPIVQILANWETEAEAFEHEMFLIKCFKDMGYELANLTDGGEGTSGLKLSDLHKEKISKALKGRPGVIPSEETRKKLRESHLGQKGFWTGKAGQRKHPKEAIARLREINLGHTRNAKYKYIGTHKATGIIVELRSQQEMRNAGFDPTCIGGCCRGKRKSHKKYTWTRELLKGVKC